MIDITKIRFGIEIEAELPESTDVSKLIDRNITLKGWELGYDGSLKNGIEVKPTIKNKLFYNDSSLLQIQEVLTLLKFYKGKASLGGEGFHIHIDAKNFTNKQVLNILNQFMKQQNDIIRLFKIPSLRLKNHSLPIKKKELNELTEKDLNEFRKGTAYHNFSNILDDKYHLINICHLKVADYQTIEFNCFGNTLNFKTIKKNILWTLNFIKTTLEKE
jgi:hypothetical protein